MPLGTFDTYELVGLIEERKAPLPYFLAKYFQSVMEFSSEEVHFDYVLGERRMAPFVSPLVEGKVMANRGSTMKSFRPAYVKPKHVVRPTEVLKRKAGEAFGGTMSPAQRLQIAIMENFKLESEAVDNRLEWMVVELMKNGTITVSGDDYPEAVVDFGRDAACSVTLAGTAKWDSTAQDPMKDIEDLATAMSKADFGAAPRDLYMDPDAWTAFRAWANDSTANKNQGILDTNLAGQFLNIDRAPQVHDDNVQVVGTLSGGRFVIHVDSRQYTDEAGSQVPYLASGEVLLASPAIEGVQAYGAILDNDVLRPMRAFPKSWKKEDPSVTMTMTQSAPLPIATRVNASGYLKVL